MQNSNIWGGMFSKNNSICLVLVRENGRGKEIKNVLFYPAKLVIRSDLPVGRDRGRPRQVVMGGSQSEVGKSRPGRIRCHFYEMT